MRPPSIAASKSARNFVRNPSIGHAAASPSAQIVLPAMPCAIVAEQIDVARLAVAVGDAAADLLEPAGALAARRALTARLVREELQDAPQRLRDVGLIVHDDDAARAGHRAQRAAAAEVELLVRGAPSRA